VVWSEGVEAFDADADGRVDVLFANGIGFSSAGGALAPTLLINQTNVGGPITFADQTAARFPAGFVQQAKSLNVLDADGDGDIDVVFANAFGNQPSILINDGTATSDRHRFPVVSLGSAWAGDVENDGDIDIVFDHQGGKARLFVNDGTGHLQRRRVPGGGPEQARPRPCSSWTSTTTSTSTSSWTASPPPTLRQQRRGSSRSSPIPQVSATYATDFSDLDDDDMDLFLLSGFDEAPPEQPHPSGTSLPGTGPTRGSIRRRQRHRLLDANNDRIRT
jgi:hypothetical protein